MLLLLIFGSFKLSFLLLIYETGRSMLYIKLEFSAVTTSRNVNLDKMENNNFNIKIISVVDF
jgi:hypothetical protein